MRSDFCPKWSEIAKIPVKTRERTSQSNAKKESTTIIKLYIEAIPNINIRVEIAIAPKFLVLSVIERLDKATFEE